jgi:hypothetical protein
MALFKIQLFSRLIASLLIVEFLLGMYANLFVTFSSNTSPNPLAVIFQDGSTTLMIHVIVGGALFVLSLLVLVTALFIHRRPVTLLAIAGFASTSTAAIAGLAFVFTTYANNTLSYLMAIGFLAALVVYGTFQRPEFQEPKRGKTVETRPSSITRSNIHPLGLTILQTIAGAVVILGGTALASFNPGTINLVLGITTQVLGLLAIVSAYAIWTIKDWSIKLSRIVNIAVVIFSTGQESYTIATATSASTVAGSLGGTLIALGLCLGVVLNLPSGDATTAAN